MSHRAACAHSSHARLLLRRCNSNTWRSRPASAPAASSRSATALFASARRRVALGLGRIIVLYYRSSLYTRLANISGASFSEATMRPNPRSRATRARLGSVGARNVVSEHGGDWLDLPRSPAGERPHSWVKRDSARHINHGRPGSSAGGCVQRPAARGDRGVPGHRR